MTFWQRVQLAWVIIRTGQVPVATTTTIRTTRHTAAKKAKTRQQSRRRHT